MNPNVDARRWMDDGYCEKSIIWHKNENRNDKGTALRFCGSGQCGLEICQLLQIDSLGVDAVFRSRFLLPGETYLKCVAAMTLKSPSKRELPGTPPVHDLVLMSRIFYWRQRFLLFSFIVQQGGGHKPNNSNSNRSQLKTSRGPSNQKLTEWQWQQRLFQEAWGWTQPAARSEQQVTSCKNYNACNNRNHVAECGSQSSDGSVGVSVLAAVGPTTICSLERDSLC